MSQPADLFGPTPEDAVARANWLGRYLEVEKSYDSKLSAVMSDAAESIDQAFAGVVKSNISSAVKRVQLALAHNAIRKKIKEVFGDTADLIRGHQQDAAVAAVNAELYDQRGVLSSLFSNPNDRAQYADSLRQSAKRNVESVMARVLESEKPLSEKVYHTESIANGQVSTVINRALARGDDARAIAKDVKALIRPDVPGGVSYAAKRLGRTEINNAFHAQSINDAQNIPWVHDMEWNLSKTHVEDPGDECEIYAAQKLFDVNRVPDKPHPNCRCFVTPVNQDYDSFEDALISGQYDPYLEQQMGQQFQSGQPVAETPVAEPISEIGTITELPLPVKPKAVKWTGPEVAKPVEYQGSILENEDYDIGKSAVVDDMDAVWTSTEFDEFKGPVRAGARIAQAEGYSGMPRNIIDGIQELQEETSSYAGPDPSERPDPLLHYYGKEMVARAVHSAPTQEEVTRGIQLTHDEANSLVEGQRISMPLSSFTDDPEFSLNFAVGNFHWQSADIPHIDDAAPVVLHLMPGAKTSEMTSGEHVAFGQFDVVKVEDNPQEGVKHVTIQQHSMIEHDIEQGQKSEGYQKRGKFGDIHEEIPDIQFVDEEPVVDENAPPPRPLAEQKKVKALKAKLQKALPGVRITGFENPALHHEAAKQLVDQITGLTEKFPHVRLTQVGFGDAENAYGITYQSGLMDGVDPRLKATSSRVLLGEEYGETYPSWVEQMKTDVGKHFHAPGAEKSPAAQTITHEYGHVLMNSVGGKFGPLRVTGDQMQDALIDAYNSVAESLPEDDSYEKWLKRELSGYSFLYGDLNAEEALPEAFEAVYRLGDKATGAQKALNKLLMDRIRRIHK